MYLFPPSVTPQAGMGMEKGQDPGRPARESWLFAWSGSQYAYETCRSSEPGGWDGCPLLALYYPGRVISSNLLKLSPYRMGRKVHFTLINTSDFMLCKCYFFEDFLSIFRCFFPKFISFWTRIWPFFSLFLKGVNSHMFSSMPSKTTLIGTILP